MEQLEEDERENEIEKRKEERRKAGEGLPNSPRQPNRLRELGRDIMPQGFREEEVREDLQQCRQADVRARLPRQAFLSANSQTEREAEASREAGWRRWRKGEHERICDEILEGAVASLQRESEELRQQERQQRAELSTLRVLKERAYKTSADRESALEEEVWAEYDLELLGKQRAVVEARLRNERRLQRAKRNQLRARRRKKQRFELGLQRLAAALEVAAADPVTQREAVHAAYEALDWTLLNGHQQRRVRQVLSYALRVEDVLLSEEREVSSDESDTDCEEVRQERMAREREYARRIMQVCPAGLGEHRVPERVRALRANERLYDEVVDAAVQLCRTRNVSVGEGSQQALTAEQMA